MDRCEFRNPVDSKPILSDYDAMLGCTDQGFESVVVDRESAGPAKVRVSEQPKQPSHEFKNDPIAGHHQLHGSPPAMRFRNANVARAQGVESDAEGS